MLDEKWEYEQYISESNLINADNYKECFRHALTIIARHELEENNYWDITRKEKKKVREEVTKTLSTWFSEEKADNMVTLYGHIKDKVDRKSFEKFKKDYNKKYPIDSPDIYAPINNLENASFRRIIADAISLNCLRKRRISCDIKLFEDLYAGRIIHVDGNKKKPCLKVVFDKKTKQARISKEKNTGKDSIARAKRLFKVIAFYLTSFESTEPNGESVYFNKIYTNILNENEQYKKGFEYKYYKKIHGIEFESTICYRSDQKGKKKGWVVNKDFLDYYNVKLEEYDESQIIFSKGNQCYIYEKDGEILFPGIDLFPESV